MLAFGFHRQVWLLLVSLSVVACGDHPTDDSDSNGGLAGAASGGAGVSGTAGSAGGLGGASGSSGTAAAGGAGTSATGGAGHAGAAGAPVAGGTSGSAGTSGLGGAGGGLGGNAGGLGGSAGAGQGGSVGGAGTSGAGGVSGDAGALGTSGASGAGASGTGGAGDDPCKERSGGALIEVDVLGESLRFWTTNDAFIQEVEDSIGEIPERIPLLELEDGTDCDVRWTFHINPASPRFEDDWIDICDVELSQIEGDKAFYLTNRDFCPRFMRIEIVDAR